MAAWRRARDYTAAGTRAMACRGAVPTRFLRVLPRAHQFAEPPHFRPAKRPRLRGSRRRKRDDPFVLAGGDDLREPPLPVGSGLARHLRDALVRRASQPDDVCSENTPAARPGKRASVSRKRRTALVLSTRPAGGDTTAGTAANLATSGAAPSASRTHDTHLLLLPPPPLPNARDDTAAVRRLEAQLAGFSRTALVRSVYRLFKMREAANQTRANGDAH